MCIIDFTIRLYPIIMKYNRCISYHFTYYNNKKTNVRSKINDVKLKK